MSTLHYVVYPAALAAPTGAQVAAGWPGVAVAAGFEDAPDSSGAVIFGAPATGLDSSTAYRVATVWKDGADLSAVDVSAPFTTAAAARLYYVVYPSGLAPPTAAQVVAGWSGVAAAAGSQISPTTSAAFAFSTPASGLQGGTSYRVATAWANESFVSEVDFSAPFTTAILTSGPVSVNGEAFSRAASLIPGAATGSGAAAGQLLQVGVALLPGSAVSGGSAAGAELAVVATLIPGAASGSGAVTGALQAVSVTLLPGAAAGGAVLPGVLLVAQAGLIDGQYLSGAMVAGVLLPGQATFLPGAVSVPGSAVGQLLTASASLRAGADGVAGDAAGQTVGASASLIPGLASIPNAATGQLLGAAAQLLPGLATGGAAIPGQLLVVSSELDSGRTASGQGVLVVGQLFVSVTSLAAGGPSAERFQSSEDLAARATFIPGQVSAPGNADGVLLVAVASFVRPDVQGDVVLLAPKPRRFRP